MASLKASILDSMSSWEVSVPAAPVRGAFAVMEILDLSYLNINRYL